MTISIIRHIISFILLGSFQVFVLNNLDISSYFNIQLFIMFLLLLPINTDIWLCITAGFVSGAIIDGLSNTYGIHAFCGTALGYFRYFYIKYSLDKEEIERGMTPNLRNISFTWHLIYILICSLFYHWLMYFMEAFQFSDFWANTLKATTSGISATVLIVLTGFIFSRKTTNV